MGGRDRFPSLSPSNILARASHSSVDSMDDIHGGEATKEVWPPCRAPSVSRHPRARTCRHPPELYDRAKLSSQGSVGLFGEKLSLRMGLGHNPMRPLPPVHCG